MKQRAYFIPTTDAFMIKSMNVPGRDLSIFIAFVDICDRVQIGLYRVVNLFSCHLRSRLNHSFNTMDSKCTSISRHVVEENFDL